MSLAQLEPLKPAASTTTAPKVPPLHITYLTVHSVIGTRNSQQDKKRTLVRGGLMMVMSLQPSLTLFQSFVPVSPQPNLTLPSLHPLDFRADYPF
ncbi:hypothetical protein XELAEV_18034447mg [Xenopus laevis]|uniref:Uncharacterized protein n=1 Tax=Xenopus laevis TaxID=8355 RepID=A0A974CE09_XENLA|nr:hypothetical protein XELAEV_18034447mg [Xenopus laevis]